MIKISSHPAYNGGIITRKTHYRPQHFHLWGW